MVVLTGDGQRAPDRLKCQIEVAAFPMDRANGSVSIGLAFGSAPFLEDLERAHEVVHCLRIFLEFTVDFTYVSGHQARPVSIADIARLNQRLFEVGMRGTQVMT